MSPKDLLAIVDKALYKAKEEGRNKVVVCNKIEELIDTDSKDK
jgi:PleD family two-component response regulator